MALIDEGKVDLGNLAELLRSIAEVLRAFLPITPVFRRDGKNPRGSDNGGGPASGDPTPALGLAAPLAGAVFGHERRVNADVSIHRTW